MADVQPLFASLTAEPVAVGNPLVFVDLTGGFTSRKLDGFQREWHMSFLKNT